MGTLMTVKGEARTRGTAPNLLYADGGAKPPPHIGAAKPFQSA